MRKRGNVWTSRCNAVLTGRQQPCARLPGMQTLRVRIELVDEPGSLAGVTAALASLGVDVASVDVLEVDGRSVVDELVLRLPSTVGAQDVEDVLRLGGAVDVLSSSSTITRGDAAVTAFEVATMVLTSPADPGAPGRALAQIAYADVGAMLDVSAAEVYPLARRALDTGIPAAGRSTPDASPLAVASGWVLWVASHPPGAARLAVVARRMNVRFSATEAARLRALAGLLAALDRTSA